MKLTEKDKTFLEELETLMESKDLWVELQPGKPSYMVLRGTYGQKVHQAFRMSRQMLCGGGSGTCSMRCTSRHSRRSCS